MPQLEDTNPGKQLQSPLVKSHRPLLEQYTYSAGGKRDQSVSQSFSKMIGQKTSCGGQTWECIHSDVRDGAQYAVCRDDLGRVALEGAQWRVAVVCVHVVLVGQHGELSELYQKGEAAVQVR